MLSIGAQIKMRRIAAGLTQEELAAKMGLTQANISRIEASLKGPTVQTVVGISRALGCDVRELMGLDGQQDKEQDASLGPPHGRGSENFLLGVARRDLRLGALLRELARDSENFAEEDWNFFASSLKLALNYATEALKIKRGL